MSKLDALVLRYRPLAKKLCATFATLDFDDRYQEACMGLLSAAREWDGVRPFGPFAKAVIVNRLLRLQDREGIRRKFQRRLNDAKDPVNYEVRAVSRMSVMAFMSSLTSKERVLVHRLMLGDNQHKAAAYLETSQPTVSRMVTSMHGRWSDYNGRTDD